MATFRKRKLWRCRTSNWLQTSLFIYFTAMTAILIGEAVLLVKYQKARTLIGHEERIYLNHDGKKMNSQEQIQLPGRW